MRCLYPVEMGSNQFPCGKCNFCLQRKRNDWSFRLRRENKKAISGKFVTLTYNDLAFMEPDSGRVSEHGEEQLCKRDVQLFLKKLRFAQSEITDKLNIRFYAVGEYGERTGRPHYHILIFNVLPQIVERIEQIWSLGNVFIGNIEDASIHYVTKYVINRMDHSSDRAPPFSTQSRRPGIGAEYLKTHTKYHKDGQFNYVTMSGFKSSLPRYYRDRIFTDSEKEILREKSLGDQDASFRKELDRLQRLHADPYSAYAERVHAMYARVKRKETQTLTTL